MRAPLMKTSRLIVIALAGFLLTACGQTGPLYLPASGDHAPRDAGPAPAG